jgi:hypothetical protein
LPMALKLGLGTGGFRCQDWSCCCSEASTTCTIFRSNSPENHKKNKHFRKLLFLTRYCLTGLSSLIFRVRSTRKKSVRKTLIAALL